jgi:tetratricopeptide (TPR) repeat protein
MTLPVAAQPRQDKPQQELGQLDASPALFTVLAAINAAGYSDGIDSPHCHWLRKTIRAEVAKRNPPSVEAIREFMRKHRQEDPTWELRLYISYALLVDGAPDFKFRLPDPELPPDIYAIADFGGLLRDFHQEAGIDELWQRSQPAIEEATARYHEPATKVVAEVSAYLRVPLGLGYMGRRYQILVDLLGAPNQIHLRSFRDDYFLVLTNSPQPQVDAIRTSYLHFLIDPLAYKYGEEIDRRRILGDFALDAPALADHYKDDFLLLTTKSLVEAIEARLLPPAERVPRVNESVAQGYVLAAHFYEQLPLYEKQEQAMRLYFPSLISSIDLNRETKRLAKVVYSKERVARKVEPPPPPPPPVLSQAEKTLVEGENLYRSKSYDAARELFARALSETDERTLQATAYYGLARIAALQTASGGDPDTVVQLFEKALELGPPAQEKAWCLVYLGRLAQAMGEPHRAAVHFRAALAAEGASQGARQAAEQGLQKALPQGK